MKTGPVLTREVDHHVKDSHLDIVRLFTLKYKYLCDVVYTVNSGAMKTACYNAILLKQNIFQFFAFKSCTVLCNSTNKRFPLSRLVFTVYIVDMACKLSQISNKRV